MIVYEPNEHFLGDIFHLATSWTMVRIVRAVLGVGVYAAAICIPIVVFELQDRIALEPMIFSFLGVVLSILLVFRTNSAYDRWWEGRKQWGALVNHCRNLAVMVDATFPPDDHASRREVAVHTSNFVLALTEHLRKGVVLDHLELDEAKRAKYETKRHVPNHISADLMAVIEREYRAGHIDGYDLLNIKTHVQALLDILGACERIKKTPIPFSYATYIRIFILAYGALLPFALAPLMGVWAIVVVMFIMFAFLGLELMAAEIEGPFGLDCNDLPTGTIAATISENVFELLVPEGPQKPHHEAKLYEKIF
jgi:putative membrane protein